VSAATRVRQTTALVQAPCERIDLARWLRRVTSEEYVGFTPRTGAHKAHELIEEGGGFVFESAESIGGTTIRHRYSAEVLEPHRTLCVSPDSRGRFLKVVPVRFRTTWALSAAPADQDTTVLSCRIEVEYRNRIWLLLSALSGAPFWLWLHSKEETPRMAESIAADAQSA
jgi:hypothetical protein